MGDFRYGLFFQWFKWGPILYAEIDLQSNLEIRTRANGAEDESVLSTRTSPCSARQHGKIPRNSFYFSLAIKSVQFSSLVFWQTRTEVRTYVEF